ADAPRRLLAGASVGEDRSAGRREGLEAAGEERRGHPREDVAAARRRQPRRRDRVDGDALAVGDDRVVALEDDDGAAPGGRLAGGGEPAFADLPRVALEHAAELPRGP